MKLNHDWKSLLMDYLKTSNARELALRIKKEYDDHVVCPPSEFVFNALNICTVDSVKVVILGQDPYFNHGQANGLAFSINPSIETVKFPPSLRNIIKEVLIEYGSCEVTSGDLTPWALQGVLLLNTSLTVIQGKPLSHKDIGWEPLVKQIISKLNQKGQIAFVFWGAHAAKFKELITNKTCMILSSAHPSPLSAHCGFFGNNHFIKINEFLHNIGKSKIVW